MYAFTMHDRRCASNARPMRGKFSSSVVLRVVGGHARGLRGRWTVVVESKSYAVGARNPRPCPASTDDRRNHMAWRRRGHAERWADPSPVPAGALPFNFNLSSALTNSHRLSIDSGTGFEGPVSLHLSCLAAPRLTLFTPSGTPNHDLTALFTAELDTRTSDLPLASCSALLRSLQINSQANFHHNRGP